MRLRLIEVALAIGLMASQAVPAGADPLGFDPASTYRVELRDAPRRGPAEAPITIVSFNDFGCQYCVRAQATVAALDALYPGQLRWVFRHLPLDEEYTFAAEVSMAAAAQGAFWPMHDALFAVRGRIDLAGARALAERLGLDAGRLMRELRTGLHRVKVLADAADGYAFGITGTPTFFINGRPLRGNLAVASFVDVIDAELARGPGASGDPYARVLAEGQPRADTPGAEGPPAPELQPGLTYALGLGLPGHQDGPDDALVTVVVWSDLECPYCVRSAPIWRQARTMYSKDVRVVFRHLPLRMHPHASLAAEAVVEAAAQGRAPAMIEALYGASPALELTALLAIGERVGVDRARLAAALADRRHREAVARDAAAALALGVTGTPTVFINGMVIEPPSTWAEIAPILDGAIGAARTIASSAGISHGGVVGLLSLAAERRDAADPASLPTAETVAVAPALPDRVQAATAACLRRDATAAERWLASLPAADAARLRGLCALRGLDLSPKDLQP